MEQTCQDQLNTQSSEPISQPADALPVEGQPASEDRTPTPALVKEIWQGQWGNGNDRKNRLEAAGWNYSEVQTLVNRYADAAKRVWRGDYGVQPNRFSRLTADGYDPEVVQFIVNQTRPF